MPNEPSPVSAIDALGYTFRATGAEGFDIRLAFEKIGGEEGIVSVELRAPEKRTPAPLRLEWRVPCVDIHSHWNPSSGPMRGNRVDWNNRYSSEAAIGAPVQCLHGYDGLNRLTFACSDALNPVEIRAGIVEEDATFRCRITLFAVMPAALDAYCVQIRLDKRAVRYESALASVSEWWASMPEYRPAAVPETTRLPVYSTWYGMHQLLSPALVEAQCRLARGLGCASVIVDDGWQTDNTSRGFGFCGDWEAEPKKIPDMKAHVANVHALGMKYVLWVALPYAGTTTRTYARFRDKVLYEFQGAWVLDPRFPEVREHLIGLLADRMRQWDLDGYKLDFVDAIRIPDGKSDQPKEGRDMESLPLAVDRLLTDIRRMLCSIKPDALIEFRQGYIGPAMRKYGNFFRAGDCPNDSWRNRHRTLDVRLIAGNTPVHSDMVMWHPDDPVESAALQLWHALFSVPQVSMLLDKLPSMHLDMVRFYLSFWMAHRAALLDGKLTAHRPESLYTLVCASLNGETIWASYGEKLIALPDGPFKRHILVNGTREPGLVVDTGSTASVFRVQIVDCMGHGLSDETLNAGGLVRIAVPPSGVAFLEQT